MLRRHHDERILAEKPSRVSPDDRASVLDPRTIEEARGIVRAVTVSDEIVHYVRELVRATRTDFQYALGASPRAGLLLLRAAKAEAVLQGRVFVLPEDVQAMWAPALRHRVMLDPGLEVEGQSADSALERTLRGITVPR
jgi:MoxR-like ATPase